jgi:hypothetical protein
MQQSTVNISYNKGKGGKGIKQNGRAKSRAEYRRVNTALINNQNTKSQMGNNIESKEGFVSPDLTE